MFDKCYIVEINSSLESMFEDLADAGFDYALKQVDNSHYEITFELYSICEAREVMNIMKWYV